MKGRIRPILMYGSEKLTQKAEPTTQPFAHEQLIADLIATCKNTPTGIGIAATQIGVMTRVFIGEDNKPFINPEILKLKGVERPYQESCLSIPGLNGRVYRPKRVQLKWVDTDEVEHTQWFDGMASRIIQHEMDHLDGVCYPERMKEADRKPIEQTLGAFESGTYPPEDFDKYPIDWD